MIFISFFQLRWKKILHGPNNFVLMMHKAMAAWVVPNTPLYSLNIIQRNMQVRLSWRSNPSSLHDFVSPIWWWNIPDSIKLGENTWPHSCLTQNNSISVHESMQPKVSEMKCTWQFSTNWNYYWPDWWDRNGHPTNKQKSALYYSSKAFRSIELNEEHNKVDAG